MTLSVKPREGGQASLMGGDGVGPRQLMEIELEYCKNEANLVLEMAVSITKVQGYAKVGLMKF